MIRQELLAVMPGAPPAALPEGAVAVEAAGLTAILAPPLRNRLTGRRALLSHAAQRQANLERLMPQGTVIPALGGTLASTAEMAHALAANHPMLLDLASRLEGQVQYQVHVAWEAAAAAEHFGTDEPLDRLRARLATHVADSLAEVATETLTLPVRDAIIANHALLLPFHHVVRLDQAVERIDALWTEGLTIRQIGPSPAVSFASIGLRRISAAAIRSARRLLGVEDGAFDATRLRELRRNRLMAAAETERADLRRAAEILSGVVNYPEGESGFHLAYVWSEGRAESQQAERSAA